MPTIWRYLTSQFLKMALFSVLAFVGILLTMRMDEIAHFAALGAPLSSILRFTFYQIPYILPIAIPISCLIAAFILIQRLSTTHELTAMRACGFALRDILAPILSVAAFLSIGNFLMVSEIATKAHLTTNSLKSELRAINPLLLLNNKHLMRLKGIYFDALGPSRVGESASDIVLAFPHKQQQRLGLLVAQRLQASSAQFIGQEVTLLTSLDSKQEDQFDHLLIESMERSITSIQDFSQLLQKKVWTINNDYLNFSLLMIRIEEQKEALSRARAEHLPSEQIKELRTQLYRSFSDIARRFSIALAVLTFTLMGLSFGLRISRRRKTWSLYVAIFLTVFYLITFFVAKGVDQNWILASGLYIIPHLVLILSSLIMLKKISRGME